MIGLSNLVVLLIFLESLSWHFTLLMSKTNIIKYLMVQRFFFFLRILGLLWFPLLFLWAVLIKIGMPPFHLWFFKLSLSLDKNTFWFFSTIHKILPLFLLLKIPIFNILILVGRILVLSVSLIIEISGVYFVLIFSSITHSGWIFLTCFIRISLLFFYWVVYTFLMASFFRRFFLKTILVRDENQNSILRLMWLTICGLPPFTIFWLKINIFAQFFLKRGFLRFLIIIMAVFSLLMYYRVFHLSLYRRKTAYNVNLFIITIMIVGFF